MSMLRNAAAIVGVGTTEFSRNSGRSELRLAGEAILGALEDAGLQPEDVDGLVTYTLDNNDESEVFRAIGGRELKFFSRINYGGGGACAPVLQAAMAVACGIAKTVVVYRAMNERSEYRFGTGELKQSAVVSAKASLYGIHNVQGLRTAAACIALLMRRYMHEYGATEEDFGRIAISARDFAATNPNAWFYGKPITMDEYLQSRMIADPFRLLDCCQQSDGAVALVITSSNRARDLKRKPVLIRAAAQASCDDQFEMTSYYREDITAFSEMPSVARQLYAMADLEPNDISLAILYDHFGPTVLPQLEAFGFCGRGEAAQLVKDGVISRNGRLPVNTHGGQVGEAYVHGMNGIAEAVRQVRGCAVNQVADARNILVAAAISVPTSGIILGAP
jgi:acetyl-CoA acetyltransferase